MLLRFTVSGPAAAAVVAVSLLAPSPASGAGMVDGFSHGPLDRGLWNTCQADPDLLDFASDAASGRDYLVMRIDDERGDVSQCTGLAAADAVDDRDSLSPTFFIDSVTASAAASLDCPGPERRNGAAVIQRNELRFARSDLSPPVGDDTWYSLTFRLRAYGGDRIPECGSARWVIGQWKYERVAYESGGSPFLAQRFDNGVLHLTMEDDGCRCMIAKAGGDPDFTATPDQALLLPTPPLKCRWSEGPLNNQRCQPAHLRLGAADLATLATLPDPRRNWVRMTYRMRAGGPQGARIDVYANGRFIVRAEGDIAPHIPGNRVKFKIGHYRDKIPVRAELLLDEVCMSADAKTCDGSVSPVP